MLLKLTFALAVGLGPAWAQTTTSAIVGDVTDAQSAVVPQAKVSVKSVATGAQRETVTAENGSYRVYPLNPGDYEVTIAKQGFRTQMIRVTLEVAQTAKLDFRIDVGQVAETVTVEGVAPMLQTQDASVGGVVTTQELSVFR